MNVFTNKVCWNVHEVLQPVLGLKQVFFLSLEFLGYYGIVKDATDQAARVELHTVCQTISVDRSRLQVVG